MPPDLPKGIRRLPSGTWQVYVQVGGQFRSRTFSSDTPLRSLIEERERLRMEAKYGVQIGEPKESSFARDARLYLSLVEGMPTFTDRKYRIEQWAKVFGARPRSTITARDIRVQLERWRKSGRHGGGGLSLASLNQRRTALMHMYTTLDGPNAPNPVKEVPAYDERYSERARAESLLTCARIIRWVTPRSVSRAVLHALLWTGWPHKLLSQITANDIDFERGRVRAPRRRKGKGMDAAWVPVVPRALLALRRLIERNALGPHSTSSLHKAFRTALRKENAWRREQNRKAGTEIWRLIDEGMRPYDLRHSFATWAATKIKDDRALKELLRTNSIKRYTEGAVADRLEAARALLVEPTRPAGPRQARRAGPGSRVSAGAQED